MLVVFADAVDADDEHNRRALIRRKLFLFVVTALAINAASSFLALARSVISFV
jgi:hypothetical protein